MSPMLVRIFSISQCLNRYEQVHLSGSRSLNKIIRKEKSDKKWSPTEQTRRNPVYVLSSMSGRRSSCTLFAKPIKTLACVRLWFPFCSPVLFEGEGKCTFLFLTNWAKLKTFVYANVPNGLKCSVLDSVIKLISSQLHDDKVAL